VKSTGLTCVLLLILQGSRKKEENGISSGEVKFVDIRRNTRGEGDFLFFSDIEPRKRGEQTGLDTLVVHAVNDECWILKHFFSVEANALSTPPG
jgi:hypothetical protein